MALFRLRYVRNRSQLRTNACTSAKKKVEARKKNYINTLPVIKCVKNFDLFDTFERRISHLSVHAYLVLIVNNQMLDSMRKNTGEVHGFRYISIMRICSSVPRDVFFSLSEIMQNIRLLRAA